MLPPKKAEPVVVAAQAVDANSLPEAEENDVLATVKREDPILSPQNAP